MIACGGRLSRGGSRRGAAPSAPGPARRSARSGRGRHRTHRSRSGGEVPMPPADRSSRRARTRTARSRARESCVAPRLDRERSCRGRGSPVTQPCSKRRGLAHSHDIPGGRLESWLAVTASAPPPRERPIAVFDSGVGGLTALQELLVELPHEDFLYLGDTARFPYGERSVDELERFALDIAELLLARRAKLLVVACNAASSAALESLRERMRAAARGVEAVGVIEPESRLAAGASRNRRVGLLATSATVRSGAY